MRLGRIDQAIIAAIALSWTLYPWAISWLFPNIIRLAVFAAFAGIALWTYLRRIPGRHIEWSLLVKAMFVLYAAYALILIVGSFTFHDQPNIHWLPRYILKLLVFVYLLKYLSIEHIDRLFDLFSNAAVVLTIASIMGVVGIYLDIFDVTTVMTTQGIDHFQVLSHLWSGFDGNARFFSTNPTLFRLQSFAIEPAGYALAVAVALYWLVFMRSSTIRASILALGIALSGALGILLGIAIISMMVLFNRRVATFPKYKLAVVMVLFLGIGYGLGALNVHQQTVWKQAGMDPRTIELSRQQAGIDSRTIAPRDATKNDSMQQRVTESTKVFNYLGDHPEGAGIGGAKKLLKNSISVGYINAMADAGVAGGIFYICAFGILAWVALLAITGKYDTECDLKNRRMLAIGCAVITCLFASWQREQPDSSYWHLWIFASFMISAELFKKKRSRTENEDK